MSAVSRPTSTRSVRTLRLFERFTLGQRWEHVLLLVSFIVLALTGLVQKYRTEPISQQLLATPEALITIRNIHHFFAVVLTLEVLYHLARAIYLLARRRMSSAMFPTWQDVKDAGHMIKYLVYLTNKKPKFGKYNFEQKFTYWFLFFGIGIMVLTGFIIWFPIQVTNVMSGGVVPAAKLTHSTEAVVAVVFVLIWHGYHVLFERLNLSMFTGRLNEADMREHHTEEYERLTGQSVPPKNEDSSIEESNGGGRA
ncbi:MAG TPA: cytochrome b/b6 domain-containing protein [Anaerolineae bacterium]|nr:cytochrome b/b6 domain-containing protein [Anaerolineae bacterium]